MIDMAKEQKPRTPKTSADSETNFPSREGYKSTYLPKEVYEELEAIAGKEERSVAYLVRLACKQYLERRRKRPIVDTDG